MSAYSPAKVSRQAAEVAITNWVRYTASDSDLESLLDRLFLEQKVLRAHIVPAGEAEDNASIL